MAFQIILAEDHPIYLDALAQTISSAIPALQVFRAANYFRVFELLEEHHEHLDMLLMDLSMLGSTGLSGLRFIRSRFKELPIVVLSGHDDLPMRQQCLSAGASAFLSKTVDHREVLTLINQLLRGEYSFQATVHQINEIDPAQQRIARLTPRQCSVFQLLTEGFSNKHIANKLGIAEKTVKVYVSAILAKLEVNNRTQAACLMTEVPMCP